MTDEFRTAMQRSVMFIRLNTDEHNDALVGLAAKFADAGLAIATGLDLAGDHIGKKLQRATLLGSPLVVFMRDAEHFVLKDLRIPARYDTAANESTHLLGDIVHVVVNALDGAFS